MATDFFSRVNQEISRMGKTSVTSSKEFRGVEVSSSIVRPMRPVAIDISKLRIETNQLQHGRAFIFDPSRETARADRDGWTRFGDASWVASREKAEEWGKSYGTSPTRSMNYHELSVHLGDGHRQCGQTRLSRGALQKSAAAERKKELNPSGTSPGKALGVHTPASRASLHRREPLKQPANPLPSTSSRLESPLKPPPNLR